MEDELLDKEYSWESTFDLVRDLEECLYDLDEEFKGTVRLVVTYRAQDDA